ALWMSYEVAADGDMACICHPHIRELHQQDWVAASAYHLLPGQFRDGVAPVSTLQGRAAVICENNAITIMQFRQCLLRHGANVANVTGDGATAVAMAELHEPDFILVSTHLKGVDGLEAARFICEWNPDICTVMASGDSEMETMLRAREIGVNGWIRKPIIC